MTAAAFQRLADVPAEIEWFANLGNQSTRRAYENALADFMRFTGIVRPEEFRSIARAHVIAWRDDLVRRALSGMTASLGGVVVAVRICVRKTPPSRITRADGVKRPAVEGYDGKTPALGDHQARKLLDAPFGAQLWRLS